MIVPLGKTVCAEAIYEPVTVTFVTGIGSSVKVPYDPASFREIPPPSRIGYESRWETYAVGSKDITVSPVFRKIPVPERPDLDRSLIEKARADLEFVSDLWSSPEEEEPETVQVLNDPEDTPCADPWEALAGGLDGFQKEYLSRCLDGDPEGLLRESGRMRLPVETAINAVSEDTVGDPIVRNGEIDPEYAGKLQEVLKNADK